MYLTCEEGDEREHEGSASLKMGKGGEREGEEKRKLIIKIEVMNGEREE